MVAYDLSEKKLLKIILSLFENLVQDCIEVILIIKMPPGLDRCKRSHSLSHQREYFKNHFIISLAFFVFKQPFHFMLKQSLVWKLLSARSDFCSTASGCCLTSAVKDIFVIFRSMQHKTSQKKPLIELQVQGRYVNLSCWSFLPVSRLLNPPRC